MNNPSEVCMVQVKSGNYPDPLPPEQYEKFVTDKIQIVLFSTHPNPYPEGRKDRVRCLEHKEMFSWLIDNVWSMTESLKLKLWIYLGEEI